MTNQQNQTYKGGVKPKMPVCRESPKKQSWPSWRNYMEDTTPIVDDYEFMYEDEAWSRDD